MNKEKSSPINANNQEESLFPIHDLRAFFPPDQTMFKVLRHGTQLSEVSGGERSQWEDEGSFSEPQKAIAHARYVFSHYLAERVIVRAMKPGTQIPFECATIWESGPRANSAFTVIQDLFGEENV